ncbi:MAG: glycoside hydrolase family 16 protein [Bacteroidales bacterium]|nr:glycoside hydrolase family 16 protein [Bacteroidales bacterium]
MRIPEKNGSTGEPCTNSENPFFYGYYEIDARVVKGDQSMDSVGLWPAFWWHHAEDTMQDCNPTSKFWSEEVDIFEPGACQVKYNKTAFHYWTLEDDDYSRDYPTKGANTWKGEGFEFLFYDVDMFNWHKWGVEWLPDRLTFYYDRMPIHTISARVPSHQKPSMYIDLQIQDGDCTSPRTVANTYLGSFQVDYFRYYGLQECGEPFIRYGYLFLNWINSVSDIKEYCIFTNSSVGSNSNVVIRASDYVELRGSFLVPLGTVFEITPTPCNNL